MTGFASKRAMAQDKLKPVQKLPTAPKKMIKTLRPGHKHFQIVDKFTVTPRAGFEISNNCPVEYKSIFITAINAGWLKPVAYVTDEEYMVMQLSE